MTAPGAAYPRPPRRLLRVFATDPMRGDAAGNRITISVANEPLKPGPEGARLSVVDYDGGSGRYYEPVDLDAPALLMQEGLEPVESDPRFHQQMVYAVASKVLENFDAALGRTFRFKGGARLRLLPHAFRGVNAFYDPDLFAVLFGTFRADEENPGPNLPGQTVFTCLSHDIIAHEMTHALVHRLRPHYLEPSNRDVLAFHEGFADVVAIFQHFSFPEILTGAIQETRAHLASADTLVKLAQQFGCATGSGEALRSALDDASVADDPFGEKARKRDRLKRQQYETVTEPHERGSILVAAIFDAFFATYQARIRDLIRIATGGSGVLPEGDLHPDLVGRIAKEASKTAQNVLTMSIRAFDYLPPVDVTFGDFLRALVTADTELVPADDRGLRASMIEAFRIRGVYPDDVISLAQESLLWEDRSGEVPDLPVNLLRQQLVLSARAFDRYAPGRESDEDPTGPWAKALRHWAAENARPLDLVPGLPVALEGFHTVFRVSPDGQLLIELVARFVQAIQGAKDALPLRGGTTVIASSEGKVRYVVSKPLPSKRLRPEAHRAGERRAGLQAGFVGVADLADPSLAWGTARSLRRRRAQISFSAVNRAAWRGR
ncbi:MAG TPA: hypothetical protein VL084_08430 [Thermoanaerobaculia bacterium]|nr:hypothetical protein [Thermoanaerobaculia bacterium]